MTEITEQVGGITLHEGYVERANIIENKHPRLRRLAAALSGVALAASGCAPAYAPKAAESEYNPVAFAANNNDAQIENAIFIVVDDENDFACADTKKFLPKSSRWLKDRGVCFENASVEDPVCCPARTDIMTGQYTQNNDVRRQIDADRFRARDSLQHDLNKHGFTTMGVGKFLNGVNSGDVMSGDFESGFERNSFWNEYLYRNYHLFNKNGREYMPKRDVHTTTRTGNTLTSFIKQMARQDKPFFAYAAFYAPHNETGGKPSDPKTTKMWPKPTDENKDAPIPSFAFDVERDRRDKIPLFQYNNIPEYKVRGLNKARVRAMYDVDTQVAKTFRTLQKTGELDNTAVFFVSDNGYVLSNWWNGKAVPYRDAWNIPMMMYIPGNPNAGTTDNRNASLVDITATTYDALNIRPRHLLDGHSLLTSFDRREIFHQFSSENSNLAISESGSKAASVPSWSAIETPQGIYVEYYQNRKKPKLVTRREFYAPNDINQTKNLLYPSFADERPPRSLIKHLSKRLHRLKNCAGTTKDNTRNPCK